MATQLSKAQATLVEERHNNEAKDVQIAILHKSLEEIRAQRSYFRFFLSPSRLP
jgi:uncharacterized iron-regulated protein